MSNNLKDYANSKFEATFYIMAIFVMDFLLNDENNLKKYLRLLQTDLEI